MSRKPTLLVAFAVATTIGWAAAGAAAAPGSAAPKYFAEITPFQKKMIDKWVNPDQAPAELRAAIADAAPAIKTLLAEASCKANYDPAVLNMPIAERTPYNDAGPMTELSSNQHRNTLCLTVDKITHWHFAGLEKLGFEVQYRSDDSLETVKKRYVATKQSDNGWRVGYLAATPAAARSR